MLVLPVAGMPLNLSSTIHACMHPRVWGLCLLQRAVAEELGSILPPDYTVREGGGVGTAYG